MSYLTFLLMVAQTPGANEIMAKVAENQSRAEAARSSYVYHQNLLVRMKRSNGKLAREEDREYVVTPGPTGTKRDMVKFSGKYGVGNKEVPIAKPGEQYKGMDVDAGIVEGLADHFGNSSKSRDGISSDMFPLTAKRQKSYAFTLEGKETYRDREVYRVTFKPQKHREDDEDDDKACWEGEALIDSVEFQPVMVTTHLAFGIPVPVKVLLGTNIQHVGFKVTYQKFDDKLWFPVTYGGELKVRALFLYARTVSLGAINSDFRKADVRSDVNFEKLPDK